MAALIVRAASLRDAIGHTPAAAEPLARCETSSSRYYRWHICCSNGHTRRMGQTMDSSQKPDVRLVERTGQKPTPPEKAPEIALRSSAEDQFHTASERRAEGKALREDVPREAHGGWKPPKDRRNPVDLLLESNEGRLPELNCESQVRY